jgi:hypothetical protein
MRTFRPLTLLLWTGLVVFALVIAAAPASAQSADFSGVQPKGLPTVYVMDRQGQETKGKILSWTDSVVVLRVDDGATRTFKAGEAVRIDLRGDSLKNGALTGAGVGLAIGLMMSAACRECGGGFTIPMTLATAGIYAAIGTGIDALITGRTPFWNAGSSQSTGGGLTFNISAQRRSAFVGWRIGDDKKH